MKFIKLEILNLASLDRREGETICFEEGALGNSSIFSIVGPTGSGKSTILDAICLALYNRAPRYPRKKGDRKRNFEIFGEQEEGEKNRLSPNDPRNILTRGRKQGYSKLTFRANNGAVYRAEWSVCKKTKNYDEPVTLLYKITMKDGVPTEEQEEWAHLPQIIGLDYEQFLRTVLIAQGSFSSFIKASEEERYALLEKIIGCEDLYAGIAAMIKQKKDTASVAYGQIAASFSAQERDIIPEEELADLKTRIAGLEAEERQAKDQLVEVTGKIDWYATNEKLLGHIAAYETAFRETSRRREGKREQADRLALHDATLPAVTLYGEIKKLEASREESSRKLQAFARDIDEKEKKLKAEEEELEKLKQLSLKASDDYEQMMPHIKKAREIKTELKGLQKALDEKTAARAAAEAAKAKADTEADANERAIRKAEADLRQFKDNLTALRSEIQEEKNRLQQKAEELLAQYNEARALLAGCDAGKLQEAMTKAEKVRQDLKSAIRIQESRREKCARQREGLDETARLTECNARLEKELAGFDIEGLSRELETLRQTYTLMTSQDWKQHRAGLAEGEACPLCGATHHPYLDEGVIAPVVDGMQRLIVTKQENLNRQRAAMQQLASERSGNDGLLKGWTTSLAALSTEIAGLDKEWEALCATRPDWPSDVAALRALQPETDRNREDADGKLKEYFVLFRHAEDLRNRKDADEKARQAVEIKAAERVQSAEKQVTEANTLLETEKGKTAPLKAQQAEKDKAVRDATTVLEDAWHEVLLKKRALEQELGDKDPDLCEKALNEARAAAGKAVQDKTEEISRLREERKEVTGKADEVKSRAETEEKTSRQKKEALSAWLSDYGRDRSEPMTEEVIARLYAATDDWEGLRSELQQLAEEYTASETTLNNERKAYEAHQDKKPDQQKDELLVRRAELENRSNAELIGAQARLQRHEAAKAQMGALFDKKQEAESLKREWEEIAEAIGGDGKTLRKIAQCYTLRFLIGHANAEIRKFNSRYELMQVKNSLGIRIIDHDRADDIRDTTTLSGGETFIVSLGLALGLAALSSRNIGFENLFIDEGFGTLDPATLETVIDSLSSLQTSQGKKVGVISHTEAMSERIATQIRVIKNGNSGSSHIEIHP